MSPADYWKKVGAPKIKARKQELGRKRSTESIAHAIELASGKKTGRTLFQHWMRGTREPYVSQLVALCVEMDLKLSDFLTSAASADRLFRSSEIRQVESKTFKKRQIRTA